MFDRCVAFYCFQLHGGLSKSYQIFNILSRTIVELNYLVLLISQEASFRRNGLSKTVDREVIFDKKFIFPTSQNFILFRKSHFRTAGHIIYVALDTFPRIDYCTDVHIDERRKIKEDE